MWSLWKVQGQLHLGSILPTHMDYAFCLIYLNNTSERSLRVTTRLISGIMGRTRHWQVKVITNAFIRSCSHLYL